MRCGNCGKECDIEDMNEIRFIRMEKGKPMEKRDRVCNACRIILGSVRRI